MAALDLALAEADRRFGPVDGALLATAEAELVEAARHRTRRRPKRGRKRMAA